MTQSCVCIISTATLLTTIVGLQDSAGTKPGGTGVQVSTSTLPPKFFLEKEPEGAKSVEEIKAAAKVGDSVVVRGRIGGSKAPFVEKRAVFTLMGSGLKACSDDPGCTCKTPWDYCCETPEAIADHSSLIQVVDASGAPLRVGLRGTQGLKELSTVVVVGKVIQKEGKVLIVNADGLFVAKP